MILLTVLTLVERNTTDRLFVGSAARRTLQGLGSVSIEQGFQTCNKSCYRYFWQLRVKFFLLHTLFDLILALGNIQESLIHSDLI